MWNVRRRPNLPCNYNGMVSAVHPACLRSIRITDGPAPAVFLPTVATSELQPLPAFPPHKCHQTGNLAVELYTTDLCCTATSCFLEQLGLENWTENSRRAMILFPLHCHHQSNWMISCLYSLFWKLTKIKSKRWKSRKCHYLLLNSSVLILIISFQIIQRHTAGESSTFQPVSFLTEWQLSEINYSETVFITLPLGGRGFLQRSALWHT